MNRTKMETPYEQYVRLMNSVHELALHGQAETNQADKMRNDMGCLWSALNGAEQGKIRMLHKSLRESIEA